ncbi:MAG: GC-type dockerin domain-anchored protein [Phycisphaerales bacterium]
MTSSFANSIAALAFMVPVGMAHAQVTICAGNSRTFNFSNPSFVYRVDGSDRPIIKLVEGNTYTFNCASVSDFHPLYLTTDSFGGFGGVELTDGSVGSYTQGDTCSVCGRTSFVLTPTAGGIGSFYYQCRYHTGLGNKIQIIARPVISAQPRPVIVNLHDGAMLSIAAALPDGSPAAYQWRKGGVNINGATASTFDITNTQAANAGSYDCVVSNLCATVISAAATVTVRCGIADVAGVGGTTGPDTQLTADDIVAFLDAFFNNNLAMADLTGVGATGPPDNQVSVDDIVLFLARFFEGCP